MLRWAINDYSDDEESLREEEDEEKEHVQITNNSENEFFLNSDNDEIIINENNLNIKQKKIFEIKDLLDKVLFNLNNNQIQKSQDKFIRLQKLCNQPPKVIKKNKTPHFFIYKLYKITQKINDLSKSNKIARRFQKNIKKFSSKFEKELSECQINEENFADDENDLIFEENNNNNKIENDWFLPSDDADNDASLDKNYQNIRNHNINKYSNKAKSIKENVCMISDDNVKKELDKYCLLRSKGKITANIDHLFELYQKVSNRELAYKIQLEICYTIESNSFDQIISLDIWNLILDILPSLVNEVKRFVPLFEKLNNDLWNHSIHSCHNFANDVSHFYEILFKYIKIMEKYAKMLQNQKELTLFVRIDTILIEHVYFKDDIDILNRAMNILNLLKQNIFTESVTKSFEQKIYIFLSFNLAIRKFPQQAADVFKNIEIMNLIPFDENLFNQTIAQIGIAAFYEGKYKLANEYFEKLMKLKDYDKKIYMKQIIIQKYHLVDMNSINIFNLFSILLLNLPYIIVGFNDQFNILNKYKIYAFIEKKKMTSLREYSIVSKIINYSKTNDWMNTYYFVINELGNNLAKNNTLLNNLKKIFLCCFLLSLNYTSLKIDFLIRTFELPREIIIDVIKDMINGNGPIENTIIEFNGSLCINENIIQIYDQKTKMTYSGYDELIRIKLQLMKRNLDCYIPIKKSKSDKKIFDDSDENT